MIRVLSIGTDRRLLDRASDVSMRQQYYAERFGAMDVIVFAKGGVSVPDRRGLLSVYSTASKCKLLYGIDAWRIAKKLPIPDIITTQDPFETGLIGLIISRALNVQLHVQVHTDFICKNFRRHSFINRFRYHIAWFVLRRAVGVRTVLEGTRDAILSHGIMAHVSVLPIYVNLARHAFVERIQGDGAIRLLCIGRLEKEKGFDKAIKVLSVLSQAGHKACLTIVGNGSMRNALERQAKTLDVASMITFAGRIQNVTPFFAEHDYLLVPSKYEGYGLVIVEGLVAGITVISTDVGIARVAGAMIVSDEFTQEAVNKICRSHFDVGKGEGQATDIDTRRSMYDKDTIKKISQYSSFEDYAEKYCNDIVSLCRN